MIAMQSEGQESTPDADAHQATRSGELQNSGGNVDGGGLPPPLTTGLLAIGAAVLALMMSQIRRRSARSRHPRKHGAETTRAARGGHRSGTRGEPLRAMMSDADELARHLARMLDDKAARLESLISAANDRIAALEKLGAETAASADLGHGNPLRMPAGPIDERVYALADEGHDTVQIAGSVSRSVGEIDLILALRRSWDARKSG